MGLFDAHIYRIYRCYNDPTIGCILKYNGLS